MGKCRKKFGHLINQTVFNGMFEMFSDGYFCEVNLTVKKNKHR